MARRSTGQVVERHTKHGTVYALRFYAAGARRYETLGPSSEGWNSRRAEDELALVMSAVRSGRWAPRVRGQELLEATRPPTFHEFASSWLSGREPELAPKTVSVHRWLLSAHLLPHLAHLQLSEITAETIDRYKAAKLREGKLGPNQINKSLGLLAQILDSAADYGYVDGSNPARGRRRRVKSTRPRRPALDPSQLPTLLDGAGPLRPILSLLAGAGLRTGEACALDWRDVNLASGLVVVRSSKTQAGVRQVDLPLALRDELAIHKANAESSRPAEPVFATRSGRRETVNNLGHRLKFLARRVDPALLRLGLDPIGPEVSPYSFRRLYASLRYALGDDPVYVAEQMGHADAGGLSMRVYASALRRRERLAGVTLREYDRALEWALMGTIAADHLPTGALGDRSQATRTALQSHTLAPGPGSSAG